VPILGALSGAAVNSLFIDHPDARPRPFHCSQAGAHLRQRRNSQGIRPAPSPPDLARHVHLTPDEFRPYPAASRPRRDQGRLHQSLPRHPPKHLQGQCKPRALVRISSMEGNLKRAHKALET
jgi:hypothetical protein